MRNKSKLVFLILIVVIIMSLASTAFASASYHGEFRYRIWETQSYVSFNSYVRDINNYCTKSGTDVSYTSRGLYYDEDNNEYVLFHSCPGYSGETRTHYKTTGIDSDRAKLGFYNSDYYGILLIIDGTIE